MAPSEIIGWSFVIIGSALSLIGTITILGIIYLLITKLFRKYTNNKNKKEVKS